MLTKKTTGYAPWTVFSIGSLLTSVRPKKTALPVAYLKCYEIVKLSYYHVSDAPEATQHCTITYIYTQKKKRKEVQH